MHTIALGVGGGQFRKEIPAIRFPVAASRSSRRVHPGIFAEPGEDAGATILRISSAPVRVSSKLRLVCTCKTPKVSERYPRRGRYPAQQETSQGDRKTASAGAGNKAKSRRGGGHEPKNRDLCSVATGPASAQRTADLIAGRRGATSRRCNVSPFFSFPPSADSRCTLAAKRAAICVHG